MPDGALIDTVSLEKSWHAIHFLLSGTVDAGEDPSQFLLSGVPMPGVTDCEVLQNPADKVRRFAAFLEGISTKALFDRCDIRRARELNVYNHEYLESDSRNHAEQYLNDLREFTSRHARNGYDFLVVIA